jgi:hypothetical protein
MHNLIQHFRLDATYLLVLSFLISGFSITIPLLENYLQANPVISHDQQYKMTLPCQIIFDIQRFPICLDVPDYYYQQNSKIYEKEKIYFNTLTNINYSKIASCYYDDYILTLHKLDTKIIQTFWLII